MKRTSIVNRTPVLILPAVHHGGLGMVRSLGRIGVPVYCASPAPCAPGPWSRYSRGTFAIDPAAMPEAECVERLLAAAKTIGSRPILIPATDVAALLVARNAEVLGEAFLFPRLPASLVRSLYNKGEMQRLAEAAGVPTPGSCCPRSEADLLDFLDTAGFPLILKAVEDRNGRWEGRRTKAIARDRRELLELYAAMREPETPNLIVQEYIPGGVHGNWMFNGYFNADSDCLFGLTGRKIRQFPIGTGAATLGVCHPCESIRSTTIRFMREIGYSGILDIGYHFDPRDGLFKVFDVNPRIGSTFRLFVSDTGMDVVRALYLDLTGQPVAPGNMVPGRKWLVEDLDLAAAAGYLRQGSIGPREWVRSFGGVRETSFLSLDDPLPVLAACLEDARELLRRRRLPRPAPLPAPETEARHRPAASSPDPAGKVSAQS